MLRDINLRFRHYRTILSAPLLLLILLTYSVPYANSSINEGDEFLIVDCLLPGQIRKLGRKAIYQTARRAVKVSARECEIRGGEYVSVDQSSYASALKVWLPQAKAGDTAAQIYVGEIYEKGLGLQPDYATAAMWYQKAAEDGDSTAQINLGHLYEKGLGVPKDPQKALYWYRQASGLGDEMAFVPTQEIEGLKKEAEESKKEAEALRIQLNQTEGELNRTRQQLQQKKSGVLQEQRKLEETRRELERLQNQPQTQTSVQPDDAEIKKLQEQLKQREAELDSQGKQIATLESKATTYKSELDSINQNASSAEQAKQQAALKEKESAELKKQLEKTQADLAQQKNDARSKEQELEQAKKELQSIQTQTAGKPDESELLKLQQRLEQRESELESKSKQIAALETKATSYKSELDSMSKSASTAEQAKQQASIKEKEVGELKKQLEQTQAELERQKNDAETQQRKLDSIRIDLDKRLQKEIATSGNQSRMKELEQELKKRENSLSQLQTQVSDLEEVEEAQNKRIADLQKLNSGDTDTSDPRIVLIDPKIDLTRGLKTQIKTRSGTARTIVGKVVASKGLQSFTVNGSEEKVDSSGMFKFKKSVQKEEVPVELVAVDKKGNSTSFDFTLMPLTSEPDPMVEDPTIDFGTFHALIIGNNDYINPNWQDLKTPLNDVSMVEKVLKQKYGFKTKVLRNAKRTDILAALEKYQKDLSSKDNLLIYYAGHGQLDEENNRGYWVPIDGEHDRPVNWISTLIIADFLSTMEARHILVVADSCYSGTLTRSSLPPSKLSKDALKSIMKKKSRTALTSGDIQPVLDAGGGNYSVFAKAFIDALQENNEILTGQNLHGKVYSAVTIKVEQVPQYSPIRFAGHQSGDMLFVPVN